MAVDVAGPVRAQLARQDGQHGLVQQGHALGHPALPDQGPALEQVAAGDQIGVGVAAAELPEPPGPLGHGRGVVAAERPLELQVEQVAVGRALGLVLEQPLGPAKPAGADDLVPAQEGVDRDPDGGHGRWPGPALLQVAAAGGLEGGRGLVDLAQPPGGVAQAVQVGGAQLAGGLGGQEPLAGGRPVAAAVGVPGRRQRPGHLVHAAAPAHRMTGFRPRGRRCRGCASRW